MILRAFSHCLTPHPLAPTQAGLTQIPRSKSSSLGGAGRTRRKSFISRTGRGFSFAFRWRSQAERSIGLSGLSRSAGGARRRTLGLPFGSFAFRWRSQAVYARFALRVFHAPPAEPGGERSVCLSGPSPLQGIGPRSLTPPLAHSSPGSSPGVECPQSLGRGLGRYAGHYDPYGFALSFRLPSRDWGLSPGLHTAALRANLTVERNEKYGPGAMALWNWNGETAGSKPDPASLEGRQEREPWRPCAEERQRRLSDNRDLDLDKEV
jgi:hypothetical protein